ncbi:Conserved_hypothetical protein [Hexamita inflata]|uniref:Ankyrin repeat protein n=1 Tax=Hexamita inflata TaxID=28002 RepID=A0AA86UT27_9EUKA|nr:Conserved hypothetical protein [Hexamita inflata]CAI9963611.1 Conserved hypothetical protein [Hexamita inflata]
MDFKNDEIYEKDLTGKTPLHYAAAGGVNFNSNVFKLKLQSKLVGIQDNKGLSALMIAAELGHVDQIPFLLQEAGLKDSKNRTALILAQKANQQKAVNLLWDLEKKLRIAEPINNSVCDPQ